MTNQENVDMRNSIEFWISEAQDILEIINCGSDSISISLELASKLRDFYLFGKEDGIYIYNNAPR